jgi:alpha-beta hydrolase superfamily lysophospholipase
MSKKRSYDEVQKAFIPKTHPKENKDFLSSVKHTQSILTNKHRQGKEVNLYTQQLLPKDGVIKGIMVFSHGYAEHSSRYVEFASFLTNKFNFACCLIDHFGHGCSDGLPGYVDSLFNVSKDVVEYTEWAKKQFHKEGNKTFLFGISMGGLIGFQTIKQYPDVFNGYIALAPLVVPTHPPNFFVIKAANLLNWMAPNWALIDPQLDNLNTDLKVKEEFEGDDLSYHGKLRVGTGVAMQDAFLDLQANADKITTDILILHGTADTACDIAGSKLMNDKVASKKKDFKIYKDQNHELLWEPMGEQVVKDVCEWLQGEL